MNENKIFIFEFVSGGGFNRLNIPPYLFSEGYGMLRAIIEDFKLLKFEILTILDYRIDFLSRYLDADRVVIAHEQDNHVKLFEKCIDESEYCFIIAPEFTNILYDLTSIAKKRNKKILSVGLDGIKLGTLKIDTYNFFLNENIPTPQTFLIPYKGNQLDMDFIIHTFTRLNKAIIIKPLDGVSAESIFYFEKSEQIYNFFQNNSDILDTNRYYILQEYIEGIDLSVSLIGRKCSERLDFQEPLVLSINSQILNIKTSKIRSEYLGGTTPVKNSHMIKKTLEQYLQKFDANINGYFGVDFIITRDNQLKFIEINPRLTTSYLGVRNVIMENPAELVFNAVLNENSDPDIRMIGHSIYTRLELHYNGNFTTSEIIEKTMPKLIATIPEIIAPPITFTDSNPKEKRVYSCFISTKSKTAQDSQKRVDDIIEILREYQFFLPNMINFYNNFH